MQAGSLRADWQSAPRPRTKVFIASLGGREAPGCARWKQSQTREPSPEFLPSRRSRSSLLPKWSSRFPRSQFPLKNLISPAPKQHHRNGPKKNAAIEPNRPVPHIEEIKIHALLVRSVTAARYLPQPRYATLHPLVRFKSLPISRHFVLHDRPRPHQAHLAPHHVPKLRQFVQARLPQKPPHDRHPRVIPKLLIALPLRSQSRILVQVLLQHGIRISHHGPEFPCVKFLAPKTDPPLPVKHRPARIQHDRNRNQNA